MSAYRWLVAAGLLLLGLCAGCDARTGEGSEDAGGFTFIARIDQPTGETIAIDLGFANNGDRAIVADDDFPGVWRLTAGSGEPRAGGTINSRPQLPPGETLLLRWDAILDPGHYRLVWGANEFGHTVVEFDVERAADGGLSIGMGNVTNSAGNPPEAE